MSEALIVEIVRTPRGRRKQAVRIPSRRSRRGCARLINNGVELSTLRPVLTISLQVVVLVIGFMIYHESASLAKNGLLLSAAVMIGAATQH